MTTKPQKQSRGLRRRPTQSGSRSPGPAGRRLIETLLNDLASTNNAERWWQHRLQYHRLLGSPPEPEYHILHRLETAGTSYDHKSLRDEILRGRRGKALAHHQAAYVQAVRALWDLGMIADGSAKMYHGPLGRRRYEEDPRHFRLQETNEYVITAQGRRVLRRWRRQTGGQPWRDFDRRRHQHVQRFFSTSRRSESPRGCRPKEAGKAPKVKGKGVPANETRKHRQGASK